MDIPVLVGEWRGGLGGRSIPAKTRPIRQKVEWNLVCTGKSGFTEVYETRTIGFFAKVCS